MRSFDDKVDATKEEIKRCIDDYRKLMALPPHDHIGNLCAHDPIFSKNIERKYPSIIRTAAMAVIESEKQ